VKRQLNLKIRYFSVQLTADDDGAIYL